MSATPSDDNHILGERSISEKSVSTANISAKALKVLGATEEEVQLETAFVLRSKAPPSFSSMQRVFVETYVDEGDSLNPTSKVERVLGAPPGLKWLNAPEQNVEMRRLHTKALKTLGATIDDVRVEKALLVLGEAPGREIPAGRLPRPSVSPEVEEYESIHHISTFTMAFLPWGIIAPLNILKLQLNKVSPGAHLWVPFETEQCQAGCGVARMWATLFWSMQFANALACIYLHYNQKERGLTMLLVSHKAAIGCILMNAYFSGVIYWRIGLVGALIEWIFALLFVRKLLNVKK